MKALVNITKNGNCNLQNITKEDVTLLKDKIENAIVNNKQIFAIVTNSFAECRHKMHIDEYELERDYLYLSNDNFEIHITSKNANELRYENECFTITCGNSEVVLVF